MKFKGFAGWKWEDEFQKALSTYKPHADDAAVERMRSSLVGQIRTVALAPAPRQPLLDVVPGQHLLAEFPPFALRDDVAGMGPMRCSSREGFHGRSMLIRVPSVWRFRPSQAASVATPA